MNLNLLLSIDNFHWQSLADDRSAQLDKLILALDEIEFYQDRVWQHPDAYSLCYQWGCIHQLVYDDAFDFEFVEQNAPWMKYRHFKMLNDLWRTQALNQAEPFCSSFQDLQNHHNALNGMLGHTNTLGIFEFVECPTTRHELLIHYCSRNNALIDWEKYGHDFLPNISYSNEYLAGLHNELDTDLTERFKKNAALADRYCLEDYKKDGKGGGKIGNADTVGTEVARRNFYNYNEELSIEEEKLQKGSMRKIFQVQKNGRNIYLSIDFEKGNCFEVCDHYGVHQGEFRFDGNENDAPGTSQDTSGGHDILALR